MRRGRGNWQREQRYKCNFSEYILYIFYIPLNTYMPYFKN